MPSWNEVEQNINKEINFLKENLILSPYHQNDPIQCNDCIFRQIAIMIVSGKITINKIVFQNNKILGISDSYINETQIKTHGAYWHNKNINTIQ